MDDCGAFETNIDKGGLHERDLSGVMFDGSRGNGTVIVRDASLPGYGAKGVLTTTPSALHRV